MPLNVTCRSLVLVYCFVQRLLFEYNVTTKKAAF